MCGSHVVGFVVCVVPHVGNGFFIFLGMGICFCNDLWLGLFPHDFCYISPSSSKMGFVLVMPSGLRKRPRSRVFLSFVFGHVRAKTSLGYKLLLVGCFTYLGNSLCCRTVFPQPIILYFVVYAFVLWFEAALCYVEHSCVVLDE